MTLKTQMTSDLSVFFNTDEFAETITYTPSGGEAVSISAILEDMDPSIMDVPPPADSMLLSVKYSDISSPGRGDTFTISEETWYLVKNLGGGYYDGTWKLLISRSDKRRI
ncbi:MAG: hypothetical protein ABIG61_16435 [Planctomycetota bacterium]